jgi:hypothetical protein
MSSVSETEERGNVKIKGQYHIDKWIFNSDHARSHTTHSLMRLLSKQHLTALEHPP